MRSKERISITKSVAIGLAVSLLAVIAISLPALAEGAGGTPGVQSSPPQDTIIVVEPSSDSDPDILDQAIIPSDYSSTSVMWEILSKALIEQSK